MRRSKVLDMQFWANAGTANLTGLASGSVLWFTPTTGTAGVVHTTGVAGDWLEIPLSGKVAKLYVVYRSKIIDVGGLGAVSGANVTPIVCGQVTTIGNTVFDTPAAVASNPNGVTTASGGSRFGGDSLATLFWEGGTGQAVTSCSDVAAYSGGGMFAESTPANNDLFGWTFEVLPRYNSAATGGGISAIAPQSLEGIEKAWLAIGCFQTMAGTLATTKLEAYIRIIGFEETSK